MKPNDFVFGDNDAVVVIPADQMDNAVEHFNEAAKQEEDTKMIFDGTSIEDILRLVKEF